MTTMMKIMDGEIDDVINSAVGYLLPPDTTDGGIEEESRGNAVIFCYNTGVGFRNYDAIES